MAFPPKTEHGVLTLSGLVIADHLKVIYQVSASLASGVSVDPAWEDSCYRYDLYTTGCRFPVLSHPKMTAIYKIVLGYHATILACDVSEDPAQEDNNYHFDHYMTG